MKACFVNGEPLFSYFGEKPGMQDIEKLRVMCQVLYLFTLHFKYISTRASLFSQEHGASMAHSLLDGMGSHRSLRVWWARHTVSVRCDPVIAFYQSIENLAHSGRWTVCRCVAHMVKGVKDALK